MWVVETPEAVARLAAHTRFDFGARVILVLGALPDEAWVRKYDGRNFADVDASIVGTHVMLAAHDLGLGTTWVGHFDAPAVKGSFRRWSPTTLWRSSRWAIPPRTRSPRRCTSSDAPRMSS